MELELEPGEELRWERRANHSVGGRAVGGKLTLTNRRLGFRAHAVDRLTGGREWSVPVTRIRAADVAPRDLAGIFNGGLTKRLRIELDDDTEELFVVRKAPQIADELNRLATAGS